MRMSFQRRAEAAFNFIAVGLVAVLGIAMVVGLLTANGSNLGH
ncbi:MAG: hypothetical protein ABIO39_14945 [Caulobacteraceae bacterium]